MVALHVIDPMCVCLYSHRVLGETSGIDDLGSLRFELLGALVLGWILVYFIIWKGINESGYVSCIANSCRRSYIIDLK